MVSRFYEQLSRNRRNLGHFRKFEKISDSQNMNILYIILKHVIWRFQIYNLFREIFKFREDKAIIYFAKFVNAFVKPRNLNFSRNKLYIWNLKITRFKMIYNMLHTFRCKIPWVPGGGMVTGQIDTCIRFLDMRDMALFRLTMASRNIGFGAM